MSGASVLAAAVAALYPEGVTVHDGQVLRGADGKLPALPWVVRSVQIPDPSERSLSRAVHQRRVMVRSLVCGATAASVQVIADKLDALEGALPVAEGWRTTRLEQINAREPYEDADMTLPSGAHPLVAVIEHHFFATPTA